MDDITIAEQMHNRILSLDQLMADWQRLVKDFIYLQCLDIHSQTALHLKTPSGHTGASTISWWNTSQKNLSQAKPSMRMLAENSLKMDPCKRTFQTQADELASGTH